MRVTPGKDSMNTHRYRRGLGLAAASSAAQKAGSRLIDVSCPAMVTDRLVGTPNFIPNTYAARR